MTSLVVAIVIGVAVALLIALVIAKQRQSGRATHDHPYEMLEALFTPAERSFFGVLNQAVGKDFQLFGKVRVADVIGVRKGLSQSARTRAFNQISAKHFDYVLCATGDLSVKCVIELNDSSHQQKARQERDEFLEMACKAAGLPLIVFDARHAYSTVEVCQRIAEGIAGTQHEVVSVPAQVIADAPTSHSERLCPKCSNPMVKRVAKGGQRAGKEFWGCSTFPACRELLDV